MRSKSNSRGSRIGSSASGRDSETETETQTEKDIETETERQRDWGWKQGGAEEEKRPGQMPQDESGVR